MAEDSVTVLDLDRPEAAAAAAVVPERGQLPWVLFGATLTLLVATVAIAFGRHPAPPAADSLPVAAPDPTIEIESSDGINSGAQVWRDADGTMIGVMDLVRPYGDADVWCELTVNGQVVKATGVDGWPATCVWIRGAA